MFTDARSKRVILVAHCVLNQSAKLDRCAHYPGAMLEVAEYLARSGVGMLQMACPELLCLGLDRRVEPGTSASVQEEDSRIALLMDRASSRSTCRQIVDGLAYQIQEYRRHGFEITGVVGINGSPTCGVETTWSSGDERQGPGVFIQTLGERFRAEGWDVAIKGIKALEPARALAAVADLLARK